MDANIIAQDILNLTEAEFCEKYKYKFVTSTPDEIVAALEKIGKLDLLVNDPSVIERGGGLTLLLAKGRKFETSFYIRGRFSVDRTFDSLHAAACDKVSRILDTLRASRR